MIIDMLDQTRRKKISDKFYSEELLTPIFKQGKYIYQSPTIHQIRQRVFDQLNLFHPAVRRFLNPHIYPVGLEKNLFDARTALILKAKGL